MLSHPVRARLAYRWIQREYFAGWTDRTPLADFIPAAIATPHRRRISDRPCQACGHISHLGFICRVGECWCQR